MVFPRPGLSFLAWVCAAPLIAAIYGVTPAKGFTLGLMSGLAFFVGTCHWISHVLKQYGDLSLVAAVLLFSLLALYLSIFFGLFAWSFAFLSQRWPRLCFWLAPALWVSTEYLRAHLLTGFPWCLLGYALVDAVDLARLASVTGVYGLSFLLMMVNASIACLWLSPSKRGLCQLVSVLGGLVSLAWFSSLMRPQLPAPQQAGRIVQTNITLDQEWDLESKLSLLDELSQLSLAGPATHSEQKRSPDLILWPETPAPFYFNHDPDFRHRMREIAASSSSHFLFGFVDFRPSSTNPHLRDPYNSVALLSPEGELVSQYDKIHLVPFGEYVPYASLFFFVDKISTEAGNFKAGKRVVVPAFGSGKLGAFVCYEAVVPDLVRQFAKSGAQVFVNVTNDAWFGESSAPFQHLVMARMRAIENRRYLLRAANNGISAVIDPCGRVLQTLERNRRTVLEFSFGLESSLTLYARFGDLFAWLCLAATGASLAVLIQNRSNSRTSGV